MSRIPPLSADDLFLTEPTEISKGQVTADTSWWPSIETITVSHNKSKAITDPFTAVVESVSNGNIRAKKVEKGGSRMVLPGDKISITVDTIDDDGQPVADISAATNIDYVIPTDHCNPGASLQVQIIQISGKKAVGVVQSARYTGVQVGGSIPVKLERGNTKAEFDPGPLKTFICRLDQEPTAGGSGIAKITSISGADINCTLETADNRLELEDRYEMTVTRGEIKAQPHWPDEIGVPTVLLKEPAAASTTAIVEITAVEQTVSGRIIEYQNVPDVGSSHQVNLDRGQDTIHIDGIPIHLNSESEVSGQVTIEITGGNVPLTGQIKEYHDLPAVGTTETVTLDQGQDSVIIDGVPIELESSSEINGTVTLKITGDGFPFTGRIATYHGLPETDEVLKCQVDRGVSKTVLDGIPIYFSPASLVGELDIQLQILDSEPPVTGLLIDYPSLESGKVVKAEVENNDLSTALAEQGEYKIDLLEEADRAGTVGVRLVTVETDTIEGVVETYPGQNLDRESKKKSPFRSGKSKNDEITGRKL